MLPIPLRSPVSCTGQSHEPWWTIFRTNINHSSSERNPPPFLLEIGQTQGGFSAKFRQNPDFHVFLPEGLLCGRRLKTCVCSSRRRRRRRILDQFRHCVEAPVTRFLEGTVKASVIGWNQWISQFCKNILAVCNTRSAKNTLFGGKSPRLVNDRPVEKCRFSDPFCRYVFTFWQLF